MYTIMQLSIGTEWHCIALQSSQFPSNVSPSKLKPDLSLPIFIYLNNHPSFGYISWALKVYECNVLIKTKMKSFHEIKVRKCYFLTKIRKKFSSFDVTIQKLLTLVLFFSNNGLLHFCSIMQQATSHWHQFHDCKIYPINRQICYRN